MRTAEGVTRAHPDKVCDQIADYLLDRFLEQDPDSRVAIEVMGSHGLIAVCGEVTTKGFVDINAAVNFVLKDVGYIKNGEHYGIINNIVAQSPQIARGVDTGGAGDQGIMYGYATRETPEMLPSPYVLAMDILRKYQDMDAKSQITMDGTIAKTIVLSVSGLNESEEANLILPPARVKETKVLINPAGPWDICGFDADTGLTGRKLGVDTYGGLAPHGGGAFSGKDPSKTDRSAAYMARYVAKWLLKTYPDLRMASVGLAYAIGVAEPVMITVEAVGMDYRTNKDSELTEVVKKEFDFSPQAIIERFQLKTPKGWSYYETAQMGHFTNPKFPWEMVGQTTDQEQDDIQENTDSMEEKLEALADTNLTPEEEAVREENEAWRLGLRCNYCGKEKTRNLADTCDDCLNDN